ncbi:MAG: D-aminoacyl-tRNA deacylase [Myxococcaceae bacterium]
MRALLQRVSSASVTVDGEIVSQIDGGLVVLLGVGQGDTEQDSAWLAEKIAALRIFPDAAGKMNLSLLDTHRRLLLVSQFTLYADTHKGKRPSFVGAAPPELARALCAHCAHAFKALGVEVGEGLFGADMKVALVNDGPVTIWLDSRAP